MEQNILRDKLVRVIEEIGIRANAISDKTGLLQSDISRFKNGKILLCYSDAQKLESYLDGFKNLK